MRFRLADDERSFLGRGRSVLLSAASLRTAIVSTREEIENTLNRFMNSFDLKDWATMASILEPTIRVDYSDLRGGSPREISAADYVNARVEALQHHSTQHLLSNIDVAAADGSASVNASCVIFRSDGAKQFDSHAFYTFSLVRLGSVWRIAAITQRILWNEGDPTIHKGAASKLEQ